VIGPLLRLHALRTRCSGVIGFPLLGLALAAAAWGGDLPARELPAGLPTFRFDFERGRVLLDGSIGLDLQGDLPPDVLVEVVKRGGVRRRAVALADGTRLVFTDALLAADELAFALTPAAVESTEGDGPDAWRVSLRIGGRASPPHELWSERVERGRGGAGWQDVRFPVHPSDARDLELRFDAEGAGGAPAAGAPRVANLRALGTARRLPALTPPRGSIVVYLVDTLRADHVQPWGGTESISPRIRELAQDALVYEQASATSSWTKASVASLLTSRYPSTIRVEGYDDAVPSSVRTLATS